MIARLMGKLPVVLPAPGRSTSRCLLAWIDAGVPPGSESGLRGLPILKPHVRYGLHGVWHELYRHPNIVLAWIPCASWAQGLALVTALRDASIATWQAGDDNGVDACAIEHMDRRSLEIVREDGADKRHNVSIPEGSELALLVQLELRPDTDAARAFAEIQESIAGSGSENDGALARFCGLLDHGGVLAESELALPGDRRRAADLLAVREAVPAGVNQRISTAKRTIDSRIEKSAGDMVVPFDRCAEMMGIYRQGFERRGLDYAIWGHLSDGNVHPNVIPRSHDDVLKGKEAMLEFGRHVARLGGCPLAEHGVGRNRRR